MEELLQLAASNQETAWKVIRENGIVPAWESIGGEVHLVGSLKTGLLLKHRDIDFHIYSNPLRFSDSFRAIRIRGFSTSNSRIFPPRTRTAWNGTRRLPMRRERSGQRT